MKTATPEQKADIINYFISNKENHTEIIAKKFKISTPCVDGILSLAFNDGTINAKGNEKKCVSCYKPAFAESVLCCECQKET